MKKEEVMMSILEKEINTREYIVANYAPYDGDESFLAQPTESTKQLWNELSAMMREEHNRGGVYDIDEKTISTITSHKPGYIHKELEKS
jgi:formate C-acetyltransferase